MVEKFFPADSVLGVDFEHGPDKFLAHGRDPLNGVGEVDFLFLDNFGKLNDVFGVERRS